MAYIKCCKRLKARPLYLFTWEMLHFFLQVGESFRSPPKSVFTLFTPTLCGGKLFFYTYQCLFPSRMAEVGIALTIKAMGTPCAHCSLPAPNSAAISQIVLVKPLKLSSFNPY